MHLEPTVVCGKESFVPDYPWAFLVASLVWLLLVFVDRAIVSHGLEGGDHHSHDHVSQSFIQMQVEKEKESAAQGGEKKEDTATAKATPEVVTLRSTAPPSNPVDKSDYDTVAGSVNHAHCSHDAVIPVGDSTKSAQLGEVNARKDAILRACVYFVALSLHSVFDGLGVGVATTMVNFASVTVAVVAHKAFDVRNGTPPPRG